MVFEKICEIINEKFDIDPSTVTMESDIREDLNADSLDLIDMISEIEEVYNLRIPTEVLTEITNIGDLVKYIETQL